MTNRMEEIASKGMGKMKAAKARMKGLTGVFKRLAEEHGEVAALLKRVASSSDPEVRRELFPKIRAELLSHEKGELQEVYPRLKEHAQTRQIAEAHEQEASELEAQIEQLHSMSYDDPKWGERFKKMADMVERHAKEEEDDYFPKACEVLGNETEALESRFDSVKKQVMQQVS